VNREHAYTLGALLVAAFFVVGLDVAICPMAGVLGVPCPSCGLTRASMALLGGDWRRAFAIHPGVAPVLVYLAAAAVTVNVWRRSPRLTRWFVALGFALIACLTLLWVARFLGHFGGPVPVRPWRW
jgi:hypothetical protein